MSQGRAVYSMQFAHYEEVPKTKAEADHQQGGWQGFAVQLTQGTPRDRRYRNRDHGQGEIRADEAARERGHDRPRGPRQDDPDGGADQGVRGQGLGHQVHPVRRGRQGVRVAGPSRRDQDPHDRDVARGVRDGEAPLRARGLPGPRRLREEHDHGRRADGRRDPGRVGGRRPDAADARAHPAGAPGERAVDRRVPEQVRPGGRRRAARPGRARGARAADASTSSRATTRR